MARNPKDTLRFRVMDLLIRRGPMTHRAMHEHLGADPTDVMTELDRMKADNEVKQAGARGAFELTISGKDAVRAMVSEPVDMSAVNAVVGIARRITAKEAERQGLDQGFAERLAAAARDVEAATAMLAQAQTALGEVRLAQHTAKANLDDEIRALYAQLAERVRS